MKKKKWFIFVFLSGLLAMSYAFSPIRIQLDKKTIDFDNNQILIDKQGRLLVPIREAGKQFGFTVDYVHKSKRIIMKKGNQNVDMTVNQNMYTYNDQERKMDTSPVIENERAYVPVRFVAEAFAYDVRYQEKERMVELASPKEQTVSPPSDNPPVVIPPVTSPPYDGDNVGSDNSEETPPATQAPPVSPLLPDNPNEAVLPTEKEDDGCYIVRSVGHLQAMKEDMDGCYLLGNDIDASFTEEWNGGKGFEPVGTLAKPFSGTLDGQGYKIDGLFIDRPDERHVGILNGWGAEIKNLSLANARVTGASNLPTKTDLAFDYENYSMTGALAGFAAESHVENVHIEGAVVVGNDTAGSLIAASFATTLNDITAENINVKSTTYAGGVLGADGYGSRMKNIKAKDVRVESFFAVGGLTSRLDDSFLHQSSTTDVTAESKHSNLYKEGYAGGLVGYDLENSTISDSEVRHSTIKGFYAGGMAGMLNKTTISNVNIEEVLVEGLRYAGGLFGFIESGGSGVQVFDSKVLHATLKAQYAGGIAALLQGATIERVTVEEIEVEGTEIAAGLFAVDNGYSLVQDAAVWQTSVTGRNTAGIGAVLHQTTIRAVTLEELSVEAMEYAAGLFNYAEEHSKATDIEMRNSTVKGNQAAGIVNTSYNVVIEDVRLTETFVEGKEFASAVVLLATDSNFKGISLEIVFVNSVHFASGLAMQSLNSLFENINVTNTDIQGGTDTYSIFKDDKGHNSVTNVNF